MKADIWYRKEILLLYKEITVELPYNFLLITEGEGFVHEDAGFDHIWGFTGNVFQLLGSAPSWVVTWGRHRVLCPQPHCKVLWLPLGHTPHQVVLAQIQTLASQNWAVVRCHERKWAPRPPAHIWEGDTCILTALNRSTGTVFQRDWLIKSQYTVT